MFCGLDPADTEGNILRAEASITVGIERLTGTRWCTPTHAYRYDKG